MALTGIYVCAKIEHAPLMRKLRDEGYPIISRWIDVKLDESDDEATAKLWDEIIKEDLLKTSHLVVYLPSTSQLKGGFVEAGSLWMLSWMRPEIRIHLVSALNNAEIRKVLGTWPASKKVQRWQHNNIRPVMDIITSPSRVRA